MVNIDQLNEMMTAAQNDIEQIIHASREEFFRPETDRAVVQMWLDLPLVMKAAITAKNPKLAKNLNKKADDLRRGR